MSSARGSRTPRGDGRPPPVPAVTPSNRPRVPSHTRSLLRLQRSVGNRATTAYVQRDDDALTAEFDRTAIPVQDPQPDPDEQMANEFDASAVAVPDERQPGPDEQIANEFDESAVVLPPAPMFETKVESAARDFAEADRTQLEEVGAFLEAYAGWVEQDRRSAETEIKGDHVDASTSFSLDSAVGAYARVKAGDVARGPGSQLGGVDTGVFEDLLRSTFVLMEAGLIAGSQFNAKAAAKLKLPRDVALKLATSVEAFVGVRAHAKAKAWLTRLGGMPVGGGVEGAAEAFSGVRGQADLTVGVDLGELGLSSTLTGYGDVGAGAIAKGAAVVDPRSGKIAVYAATGATVGAHARAKAGGRGSLLGEMAIDLELAPQVIAGAGGEIEVSFFLSGGKLVLGFKGLAAAGVGGGLAMRLQVDAKPIARAIMILHHRRKWATKAKQDGPSITQLVSSHVDSKRSERRAELVAHLRMYRNHKLSQLAAESAGGFVKRSRLTEIINRVIPVGQIETLRPPFRKEIDDLIADAIAEACSVRERGVKVSVSVEDGKIRSIDLEPADAIARLKGAGAAAIGPAVGVGAGTDGSSSFGVAFAEMDNDDADGDGQADHAYNPSADWGPMTATGPGGALGPDHDESK